MVATIQSKIKTFFCEKSGAELFFNCLIFSVVIMGIAFRSQGYFNGNISLWFDEADWVFRLSDRSLFINAILRPIGFVLATKFLMTIANNEITLRLMPYSASILSIPLIYLIAKEVFKSKLTVFLAVFLVSFNPVLINFAKEFKPYSLELCLHLLVLYLLVRYIKLKTTRLLYQILCVAAVTLFFAYNIVFLYPSLFLIVLFKTYKEQKFQRFLFLLLIASLSLGLLYASYYFIWSNWNLASTKIYWGGKYNVFCLSSNFLDYSQWILKKYVSLVECSGIANIFWGINFDGYRIIKVVLWACHCIGLATLVVRRKWEYLLLFVLPIVIIIAVNIIGMWPFGAFRANVFMFCYFLIISLYGIDAIITIDNRLARRTATSIIVAIFFVLQFPLTISHYTIKVPIVSVRGYWTANSYMRSVLDTISSYELSKSVETGQREECVILADKLSFSPVKYYLWNHSTLSKKYEHLHSISRLHLVNTGFPCDKVIKSLKKITTNPGMAGKRVWILTSTYPCNNKVDQSVIKKNNIILKKHFKGRNLLIYYQI